MPDYGYHASHEQFAPADLLRWARHAEAAGFTAAMCSDHLFPWLPSHRDGCGFAYAWLGAALEATTLPYGVVTAPGQRHHPTMVAQATATLAQMYPGRFWVAVGSGEAANEHVTGDPWPEKSVRMARLRECVDVIRALWAGELVNHDGLVRVRDARVYTTGAPPLLVAAAVSAETARWAGGWADAMVTVNGPLEQVRRVVEAFREGGGTGPVRLQYHLSWAATDDEALRHAHDQWRHAVLGAPLLWDLEMPEQFAAAAGSPDEDKLREVIAIGSDLDRHAARLAEFAELGFDQILLHQVGPDQDGFLDAFGAKVLPNCPQ